MRSKHAFRCLFSSISLLQAKRSNIRSLCIFVITVISGRILITRDHSSLQLTTYWKSYLNEAKVSYSLAAWTQPYLFTLCTLNSTFRAFIAHCMTDSNVKKKKTAFDVVNIFVDYFCRIFCKQNLFAILFYLFFSIYFLSIFFLRSADDRKYNFFARRN